MFDVGREKKDVGDFYSWLNVPVEASKIDICKSKIEFYERIMIL